MKLMVSFIFAVLTVSTPLTAIGEGAFPANNNGSVLFGDAKPTLAGDKKVSSETVECRCGDGTKAVKVCPTSAYDCNCPNASISCR